MKNIITLTEKSGENKKLLAIKYIDKTAMVEMAKVSSTIDFVNKHSWAISNADIDVVGDLELIGIKKY